MIECIEPCGYKTEYESILSLSLSLDEKKKIKLDGIDYNKENISKKINIIISQIQYLSRNTIEIIRKFHQFAKKKNTHIYSIYLQKPFLNVYVPLMVNN